MYYYIISIITHWSSQSSQTKKKTQCTYWMQLHRVISKARWPGDWNRWIQPFRPCLVPRSLQGKGGEGVWPGMGIHGYSSLYHPSHQLKKTRDNGRIVQYILLFLTSLKNCTWMTEWYEYRIMLDLDYCRVPAQPNLAACPMLTPQQT